MLKKIKNDNTGSIYITRTICYFLLVIVLGFTLDVIVVLAQNVVTSYEAAYYAEKISIQGGLLGNDEDKRYPSINEVKNTSGNACYDYKPACQGCLKNSDIGSKMSETFGYFGINNNEWHGELFINGNPVVIHSRTSGGSVDGKRVVSDYMSTATFKVSTDWQPIFAKWMWGKREFIIDKEVPIIIEYIAQIDKNDPACIGSMYGG